MIGLAAGLAISGMKVICYTITPFITFRCLEQIRDDLCYHDLPVVIVGVGAGMSYAGLGPTHHSCEDIAVLRSLPNMTVLCPGDPVEVALSLNAALELTGPSYIRLGKKGEPLVHQETPCFEIGKMIPLKEGSEICILSTGNLLPLADDLQKGLEDKGFSTGLFSCHSVKPLDIEGLKEVFANYRFVLSLEEHSLIGGFSSALSEWMIDEGLDGSRLLRLGTEDHFFHEAGSQGYARKKLGLTVELILKKVLEKIVCPVL